MSTLEIEFSQTRKGSLWLPTHTWVKDLKTITIIGMVHLANQEFYTGINERVAKLEANGAKVHYELVKLPPDEDLEFQRRMFKLIHDMCKLTFQLHGVEYQKHWSNHDLNESHAHLITFKMFDEETKELLMKVERSWFLRKLAAPLMRWALRNMSAVKEFSDKYGTKDANYQAREAIIIDKRNEIAIKAALEEQGDVVLLWGAGHLPGMAKLLTEAGYSLTNIEWHRAIAK